jgi:ubiquinone/menaquinone biosynthesis C-methylase UbiE
MSVEIYTPGHGQAVIEFMSRRTVATHAQFIESLLKPGRRVLDLGCGPGTITLDLARRLIPFGSVVGVDSSETQFLEARAATGALPVIFHAMDAYRLELEDGSFDGVFSHALFEHLSQPLNVLREVRRVLKPDGFVALRSPDWGGFVVHPWEEKIETAMKARMELQTRNGGDVYAGRKLGDWLRQSGFESVQLSASYEIYPENDPIVEHIASQLERDEQRESASVWRSWGENPQAMFAQAWFEAIAFKGRRVMPRRGRRTQPGIETQYAL